MGKDRAVIADEVPVNVVGKDTVPADDHGGGHEDKVDAGGGLSFSSESRERPDGAMRREHGY